MPDYIEVDRPVLEKAIRALNNSPFHVNREVAKELLDAVKHTDDLRRVVEQLERY